MKTIKIITISSLLSLLVACGEERVAVQNENAADVEEQSIEDFFQEFTDDWMRLNPHIAVRYQFFPEGEEYQLSRELTPFASSEWEQAKITLAQQGLEELQSFERNQLTEDQQISSDMMQWQLQNVLDSQEFLAYDYPLQQMNGINVEIPNFLTVIYPIRSEQDAENYIEVLRQVDERMAHMKEMRQRCPVAYTDRAGGGWGLLRYQDIVDATRDSENFRNGGAPRHGQALAPLEVDPPVHREYRRLLTPFFTGKNMQALEP